MEEVALARFPFSFVDEIDSRIDAILEVLIVAEQISHDRLCTVMGPGTMRGVSVDGLLVYTLKYEFRNDKYCSIEIIESYHADWEHLRQGRHYHK